MVVMNMQPPKTRKALAPRFPLLSLSVYILVLKGELATDASALVICGTVNVVIIAVV